MNPRWLLLTTWLIIGCSNGINRFEVSGTVTWKGEPVPAGEVLFEPDPDAQHDGPQARAAIENGRFRTPPGEGVVGGPHIVIVLGFDGQAIPESTIGRQIFPASESKHDFPMKAVVLDLNVPATERK